MSASKCKELAARIKLAPGEEDKFVDALIDLESPSDDPVIKLDFL